MPPAVALLNYISCGILWRIFSQTGTFVGFFYLSFAGRNSEAVIGRGHYIFRVPNSLQGCDGWGEGRGILYIKSLWSPGKIYASGSPSSA